MIIITGAAGFIGSCLVKKMNDEGHTQDLVVVDDFSKTKKDPNLANKSIRKRIERAVFIAWLEENHEQVDFIFHLGARTDTTEQSTEIFDELNLNYSKDIWRICTEHQIPLVYASSAATYGLGENGYVDSHSIVSELKPLNPYGVSKNDFDIWALQQKTTPPNWAGLKFFNVYGPNEYHKGRMASVIFHTCRQIKKTGGMKLFRSHRADYKNGEQSRDFVYVKDVVEVCRFFYEKFCPLRPLKGELLFGFAEKGKVALGRVPPLGGGGGISGLYNLGTGIARTFYDLAKNTFLSMGKEPNISFIDTPEDIRETYQYFTEADMSKLRKAGYEKPFSTLEEGIEDYVKNYLIEERIW